MAMVTCPECEKEISSTAKVCPNCGYKIKKRKKVDGKTIGVMLGILVVAVVCVWGYKKYQSNKVDETSVAGNVVEITDDEIIDLNKIEWKSEDSSIIDIIDGKPVGVAVGTTTITAMKNGAEVSSYKVEIIPSPITEIALEDIKKIYLGVDQKIKYQVKPADTSSDIIMMTDDENVAIVQNGKLKAISEGTVDLILSNGSGVETRCTVKVVDNPYMLLSDAEKEFFDDFSGFLTASWFDDPQNIELLAVEKLKDGWAINYKESDGTEKMFMWSDDGSVDWSSHLLATHNEFYNLEKLNKVVKERWKVGSDY